MLYRPIKENVPPNNVEVRVIWGENEARPEEWYASRNGDKWFWLRQTNPHADGKACRTPDGWLPVDEKDWTRAERALNYLLGTYAGASDLIKRMRF
mgnify:CR=1 FL=1